MHALKCMCSIRKKNKHIHSAPRKQSTANNALLVAMTQTAMQKYSKRKIVFTPFRMAPLTGQQYFLNHHDIQRCSLQAAAESLI